MEFNEWVATIDNATSVFMAGMVLIQTIFIGFGLWIGKDYLNQHKEKIKKERELEMIYDTMVILGETMKIYANLFSISQYLENAGIKSIYQEYEKSLEKNQDLRLLEIKTKINLALIGDEASRKYNDRMIDFLEKIEDLYLELGRALSENNFLEDEKILKIYQLIPKSLADDKNKLSLGLINSYALTLNALKKLYQT
jgi:hypothetical protein